MSKTRVSIIGGGNMGAAILAGIRKKFSVRVCELDAKRRRVLKSKFRIGSTDLKAALKHSRIIILAVKPQSFEKLLKEIKAHNIKGKLFISIAAGITTQYIEKRLGSGVKVIRTMPNLPAQIAKGITAIAKGKNARKADVSTAVRIFNNVGTTIVVNEKSLDAITAVSGSGPAYVFYFVESLVTAAAKLGLSKAAADELIRQTLCGSLLLLDQSSDSSAALRKKVTSKGGTTEAALKVLKRKKFKSSLVEAVMAAKLRARRLSK